MKNYFKTIQISQKIFLAVSILLMLILPILIVFKPSLISSKVIEFLYNVSHITVFFVMIIRPLADIFTNSNKIRPLVILRKGAGVFSASIIMSFILAKIIMSPSGYFLSIFTLQYWSFYNFAILAHIADISAILLIITSNNFSKRILGNRWKIIQKLSYPYFYSSALYVFLISNKYSMLISIFIVTILTMIAYIKNKNKKQIAI